MSILFVSICLSRGVSWGAWGLRPPGYLRGAKKEDKGKERGRKREEKRGKEREKRKKNINLYDDYGAIQGLQGRKLGGGGGVRVPFFNFAPGRHN